MSEKRGIFTLTDCKSSKRVACMFWDDGSAEKNWKRIQSPNYMSIKGFHKLGNDVWIYVCQGDLGQVLTWWEINPTIHIISWFGCGWAIFIKEFLKDSKDSDFLICISSLFKSSMEYGKQEYFNTSILQ